MPTRREWRTGFLVGLFLFGPGLEKYLRDRAASSTSQAWASFYEGLGDIVVEAGTQPEKAAKLADALYDRLILNRVPRTRLGPTSRPSRRALPGPRRAR